MGDAQFDGGGSVKWKVKPSKGDPYHGNPNGANGKDKDPDPSSDPNAQFTINITGLSEITVPVRGTTITIHWPGSSLTASRSAMAKPTATRATKRAMTTKKSARSTKTARSAKKK